MESLKQHLQRLHRAKAYQSKQSRPLGNEEMNLAQQSELQSNPSDAHSSPRAMGVTKIPLAGPSVKGERTSSGTCPGDSLNSNLTHTQELFFKLCFEEGQA